MNEVTTLAIMDLSVRVAQSSSVEVTPGCGASTTSEISRWIWNHSREIPNLSIATGSESATIVTYTDRAKFAVTRHAG